MGFKAENISEEKRNDSLAHENKKWNEQSSRCPKAAKGFEPYHKWIPVYRSKSNNVTGLMCGICFHEIIVSDAHRYRDCFKTEQTLDTSL